MTAPSIVYRPLLFLQELDAAGADVGTAVDVSCDMVSVDLTPNPTTVDVSNFCGDYSLPGPLQPDASFEVAVGPDTSANWAPLVGKTVRAEVFDRAADNVVGGKYRHFDTYIAFNPALYGPATPGEVRQFEFEVPILSEVEEGTVAV